MTARKIYPGIGITGASVALLTAMGLVPAKAQVRNWTGFYVGGFVQETWAHSDATSSADCRTGNTGYFCDTTFFPSSPLNSALIGNLLTGASSGQSFGGGGFLGMNWQTGYLVYGLEADLSSMHFSQSRTATSTFPALAGALPPGTPFTVGAEVEANWLATYRARLGFAYQNLLFYGTGGFAFTRLRVSNSYADNNLSGGGTVGAGASSNTRNLTGWTAGAGVQYALGNNWSLKAEYLYVKFGSVSTTATVLKTSTSAAYVSAITTSADLALQTARIGLLYQF